MWLKRDGYCLTSMERKTKISSKLTIKTYTRVYDAIYRKTQRMLDEHDPCKKHIDPKTGKLACYKYSPISECCGHAVCEHLTEDGCKIKCLACKLHLCSEAETLFNRENPKIYKRWAVWQFMVKRLGMWYPWSPREFVIDMVSQT